MKTKQQKKNRKNTKIIPQSSKQNIDFVNQKRQRKISRILIILTTKSIKIKNPIYLAIIILVISLIRARILYKSIIRRWIAFVLILTFSSGIITLFMYTASITSNKKTTNRKSPIILMIITITIAIPTNFTKESKET